MDNINQVRNPRVYFLRDIDWLEKAGLPVQQNFPSLLSLMITLGCLVVLGLGCCLDRTPPFGASPTHHGAIAPAGLRECVDDIFFSRKHRNPPASLRSSDLCGNRASVLLINQFFRTSLEIDFQPRPHRALAPMNKDAQGRWKVGMSNTTRVKLVGPTKTIITRALARRSLGGSNINQVRRAPWRLPHRYTTGTGRLDIFSKPVWDGIVDFSAPCDRQTHLRRL